MRKLTIKISGIKSKSKPQIEWGPFEYDDIIAKAIVNVLTPGYLELLRVEGRIDVVNETEDSKEYEYSYH